MKCCVKVDKDKKICPIFLLALFCEKAFVKKPMEKTRKPLKTKYFEKLLNRIAKKSTKTLR